VCYPSTQLGLRYIPTQTDAANCGVFLMRRQSENRILRLSGDVAALEILYFYFTQQDYRSTYNSTTRCSLGAFECTVRF
jgi:hypothetical protein